MQDTSKIPNLQPEKKAKKKKSPAIVCAQCAAVTLLTIYLAVCWQGEQVLRNGVKVFFKELAGNGFNVSYGEPKSSYLAFKSSVYVDDLIIGAPQKSGGWQFRAGRAVFALNPLSPSNVSVSFAGTHSLELPGYADVRFIAETAEAEIGLKSLRPSVKAVLKGVRTVAPTGAAGAGVEFFSFNAEYEKSTAETLSYTFRIEAQDAVLPPAFARNLPERAEYLSISGTIDGLPAVRRAGVFKDWIANGGVIDIVKGELIWKPLMAEFSGTAAFDPSLKITAASTAKTYGFFEMLDLLEKQGIVRAGNSSVAKVVLGRDLVSQAGENQPSLTTSFTFQDGILYAGRIVLIDKIKKTDAEKNRAR